jgi:hypothetical protein
MAFRNPLTLPADLATTADVTAAVDPLALQATLTTKASQASVDTKAPTTAVEAVQEGQHGYAFRDVFYWPGISGESFPPGLGGTGYSAHLGRPCYLYQTPTATVQWSQIPRVSPADPTKETLILEWDWADTASADPASATAAQKFGYGELAINNNGLGVRVYRDDGIAPKNWKLQTADGTAQQTTDTGTPYDGSGAWHKFKLKLLAASVELYIDDVLEATHATRFWAPNLGSSLVMQASANDGTYRLCRVKASWE